MTKGFLQNEKIVKAKVTVQMYRLSRAFTVPEFINPFVLSGLILPLLFGPIHFLYKGVWLVFIIILFCRNFWM